MTSTRQQAREERRAAHFRARYAAAGDDPVATEVVARDEWKAVVVSLPEVEIKIEMTAVATYLRQRTRELRMRGK